MGKETPKIDQPLPSEIFLFNRVFRLYLSPLTGYARKFIGEDEADDVVQDVFLKVWKLARFRMDEPELKYYLYRAVLNACRDRIRHRKVDRDFTARTLARIQLEEIAFYESNGEELFPDERLSLLHRQAEQLPEKCREIFRSFYSDGKKSAQIAQEKGISKRTVEAQLYKALKILRDLLR